MISFKIPNHFHIYHLNISEHELNISLIFFFLQSQFRFDNECYLNLPDNHKRVSFTPSTALNKIVEQRTSQDGNDDARNNTNNANDSNFNLVCDDFNIASVSMPVYFFILYFYFLFSYFCYFYLFVTLYLCPGFFLLISPFSIKKFSLF